MKSTERSHRITDHDAHRPRWAEHLMPRRSESDDGSRRWREEIDHDRLTSFVGEVMMFWRSDPLDGHDGDVFVRQRRMGYQPERALSMTLGRLAGQDPLKLRFRLLAAVAVGRPGGPNHLSGGGVTASADAESGWLTAAAIAALDPLDRATAATEPAEPGLFVVDGTAHRLRQGNPDRQHGMCDGQHHQHQPAEGVSLRVGGWNRHGGQPAR